MCFTLMADICILAKLEGASQDHEVYVAYISIYRASN